MAKPIVTDELWESIEPLLPEEPPKLKGAGPASKIAQPSPASNLTFATLKWNHAETPGDGFLIGTSKSTRHNG